ncbi:MAG TPA: nucleotidyltransferase family protein [Planctomycetota bacterium]|nr:nucleotidyltransferase family protein [Planctomycetota bacterium]
MELQEALTILREHEAEVREHHVKALSIFGSVVRGEASDASDIDILVEFDQRVGLLTFVGLKLFLEGILGRPVDLVTPSGLRDSMRKSVLKEAIRVA